MYYTSTLVEEAHQTVGAGFVGTLQPMETLFIVPLQQLGMLSVEWFNNVLFYIDPFVAVTGPHEKFIHF